MSGRGFFITGTDTGVGKTWASVALLAALQRRGLSAVGMKPVASGAERTREGLRNEDALLLQRHGSVLLPYETVNPYAFEPPVSPHIAAAEAGVAIDPERIAAVYRRVAAAAEVTVVEGVGGWLAPLSATLTVADLAERLALPVVLVVGLRLGCLNHALLSAEAIRRSKLPLAGWIGNAVVPDFDRREANLAYLCERLAAPLLGLLPYAPALEATTLGAHLELSPLLD